MAAAYIVHDTDVAHLKIDERKFDASHASLQWLVGNDRYCQMCLDLSPIIIRIELCELLRIMAWSSSSPLALVKGIWLKYQSPRPGSTLLAFQMQGPANLTGVHHWNGDLFLEVSNREKRTLTWRSIRVKAASRRPLEDVSIMVRIFFVQALNVLS